MVGDVPNPWVLSDLQIGLVGSKGVLTRSWSGPKCYNGLMSPYLIDS